jgi:hypothetical protein
MEGRCNTTWQETLCGAPAASASSTACRERTWFCGWDESAKRCGVGAAKQPVAAMCAEAERAGVGVFGAKNAHLSGHLILKMRIFSTNALYQDKLGTNMGKTQKEMHFSQVRGIILCCLTR